jgi:hypothetical protein
VVVVSIPKAELKQRDENNLNLKKCSFGIIILPNVCDIIFLESHFETTNALLPACEIGR